MLATTLGIEFDQDQAWQEREQIYKASGKIFKTTHICQSAQGEKTGKWTTVIAVAVFVEENGTQPSSASAPVLDQKRIRRQNRGRVWPPSWRPRRFPGSGFASLSIA